VITKPLLPLPPSRAVVAKEPSWMSAPLCRDAYAAMRFELVALILARKWTPSVVADYLESCRELHPEIESAEIERYRGMGDAWRER
jgi:hypothetical protein